MKQQWAIEDFALSQATLEDVFHTLAETSKQYAFSFRIFSNFSREQNDQSTSEETHRRSDLGIMFLNFLIIPKILLSKFKYFCIKVLSRICELLMG